MPAQCAVFIGDRGTLVRIGLRGGGGSRMRTGLCLTFDLLSLREQGFFDELDR